MKKTFALIALVTVLALLALPSVVMFADGTETLGPPSISIASGSGFVAAGTGLETQPGSITIDVPAGATVKQVLLYWSNEFYGTGDDTVNVNAIPVTGTSIGGPTVFYYFNGDVKLQSFRADITALGLVGAGANTLTIDGLDPLGLGAGVLVIFDDGSSTADIQIRDGNDLAYIGFAPPLDTTVPQTFDFAPAAADRTADLVIFAGSVGGAGRPNAVAITVEGTTTTVVNPLGSFDGNYWDTAHLSAFIPAGASSLTVQVLSQGDGSGNQPASLNWIGAGLSVPPVEGEGCTPGFWKNPKKYVFWPAAYQPGDLFYPVFGRDAFPGQTLGETIKLKGGGLNYLGRAATAALLNAASFSTYPYTEAEVISMFQAAYDSGNYEDTADDFDDANNLGCPY